MEKKGKDIEVAGRGPGQGGFQCALKDGQWLMILYPGFPPTIDASAPQEAKVILVYLGRPKGQVVHYG